MPPPDGHSLRGVAISLCRCASTTGILGWYAGPMATKTPPATPELSIDLPLRDGTARPMRCVFPNENQLAVWQSAGERFTRLGEDWARREQALSNLPDDDPRVEAFRKERNQQAGRTLSRALTMIKSALADDRDRDWLEDQLLYNELDLSDALKVLTLLSDKLAETRQERQAATKKVPAGKARLAA